MAADSTCLAQVVEEIKRYRKEHVVNFATALEQAPLRAKRLFEEMTGYTVRNPDSIGHERLSFWGAPCSQCGHLLRTPLARACAHCGHPLENEAQNSGRS